MYFSDLSVQNYRCLRNVKTNLSKFTTIIGENNSGKSSLLQGLSLFLRGTKLLPIDFYNSNEDIVIKVTLSEISEQDILCLGEQHRERILSLLQNKSLCLIRRYKPDGSSSIRCIRSIPREPRYRSEILSEVLRGKTGTVLHEYLSTTFPEFIDQFVENTQVGAKRVIEEIVSRLPPTEFVDEEADLPTGIDNSIKNIFPEPIYIPAVKDFSDDVKTKETTSFGRLLSVLLNVISGQLTDSEEIFTSINRKLNRIKNEDGNWDDQRLKEVQTIEQTVTRYVQENFPNISLEIQVPPPEIKTILSSAKVVVNDGIQGTIETKGDGLKRAVTFAILRSFVTLSTKPEWQKPGGKESRITDRYIFLFEEPELYLHPSAQMVLYEALSQISTNNQVILSTHSPLFLSPSTVGTFIKIKKKIEEDGRSPYSILLPIDLSDIESRDLFQMICFENNNAAFFADRIVLIEGDSDHICYSHIAKTINPNWDFTKYRTAMIRIGGKGNIQRYREFFTRFDIQTYVIADLDILIKDFDKLGLPENINKQRGTLLALVDRIISDEGIGGEFCPEKIKQGVKKFSWKEKWEMFKESASKVSRGVPITPEEIEVIEQLLVIDREEPRLIVLKSHQAIQGRKRNLLSLLRQYGVFVLEKGAIEDYYPPEILGKDKPSKAKIFCTMYPDSTSIKMRCNKVSIDDDRKEISEFEAIFEPMFTV